MAAQIKRILVPIDFSENSLVAEELADIQAEAFNATVHLLHVMDNSAYEAELQKGMMGEGLIPHLIESVPPSSEIGKRIKTFTDKAQAELDQFAKGGTVPHKTMLKHGPVVETILATIDEFKPDLLVMCTHGSTGLQHLLMGSVTEKVVRLSPVPVLTCRAKK